MYYDRVRCFDSLRVRDITVEKKRVKGTVDLSYDGQTDSFRLVFTYSREISPSVNLAGLILTMPLINFAYFTGRIELEFPVTKVDAEMLTHFTRVNNREVFINKVCRRRYEFLRKEYLPEEGEITPENAAGGTRIFASSETVESGVQRPDARKAAVLSSGGKESLLTYGIMRDVGADVYPFFFNESGGHWLSAKMAYDSISKEDSNTMKVWSNVDRFYRFMLRRMKILDRSLIQRKTDTYPVQLFIFPVYIFALLPLAFSLGIGNILMGNEFDDPGEMPPFHGIMHYHGIYDQSQDFNDYMSRYLTVKGIRISQWSAVYSISGSSVERMLMERFPDLFELQRSCHSCRKVGGKIMQCGNCTKCLGVMLFVLAARGRPERIGFTGESVRGLPENPELGRMRLDPDELSTVLAKSRMGNGEVHDHVDGIHELPWEEGELSRIPQEFRSRIKALLEKYTVGKFKKNGKEWVRF